MIKITDEQQSVLEKNGFVICRDRSYSTFVEGYAALFEADLPVFISADALLNALHWSFSRILTAVEREIFAPALRSMLICLRSRLASDNAAQWACAGELDLYLTIAMRLSLGELFGPDEEGPVEEICTVTGLTIERPPKIKTKPLFAKNLARLDFILSKIYEARGVEQIELLGLSRLFDFSLFTPRGAYEEDPSADYLRLVYWLRSADFRFCSLNEQGEWCFSRKALYSAFALRELFNEQARHDWQRLAGILSSLLGAFDGMSLLELDALYQWLGSPSHATLEAIGDLDLLQRLLDFPGGKQEILDVPLFVPTKKRRQKTPLPISFSLVGGVLNPEALVMSRLVYNRVGGGTIRRMMPSPLDVAFAVFQNEQAAQLLASELAQYAYQEDLTKERESFTPNKKTLRGLWIEALRSLSPSTEQEGTPDAAKTDAFGKRLLQSQLASWAELRRDTILYDKQSRTFGIICSFPDAYVEPNPRFFEALESYALRGKELQLSAQSENLEWTSAYFATLLEVSGELKEIALQQRRGEKLTEAQLRFINKMLFLHEPEMCRPRTADGWFISLYSNPADWSLVRPVIADIHTQDTNERGSVGKVLHIATGEPRLMVLAVDNARTFFGLASSYYELITEQYQRLNDELWWRMLYQTIQTPPVWVQDISIGDQLITDEERDSQRSRAERLASLKKYSFTVSEAGAFIAEALQENLIGLRAEQDLISPNSNERILRASRKITPQLAARLIEEQVVVSYSASSFLDGWFVLEDGEMRELSKEQAFQLAAHPGQKLTLFR